MGKSYLVVLEENGVWRIHLEELLDTDLLVHAMRHTIGIPGSMPALLQDSFGAFDRAIKHRHDEIGFRVLEDMLDIEKLLVNEFRGFETKANNKDLS